MGGGGGIFQGNLTRREMHRGLSGGNKLEGRFCSGGDVRRKKSGVNFTENMSVENVEGNV